jgi:predicted ATP-dependent endonuclease of OLD family
MARLAILVEGDSDRAAVLALARALGTDLADSGVVVVAMGGITNTARYVSELGP